MHLMITSEVVGAYAQCPRKAYLLLFSTEQGTLHEYVRILERQRRETCERYVDLLQHTQADVHPYTVENLSSGRAVLIHARLQTDSLAAECDVLTRVEGRARGDIHRYEPTLCMGTHSLSKEQKLALTFAGYVLGRLQPLPPLAGRLIAMDGTSHTIKLDQSATALTPLLTPPPWMDNGCLACPPSRPVE